MKKYEVPSMEIINFDVLEEITTGNSPSGIFNTDIEFEDDVTNPQYIS